MYRGGGESQRKKHVFAFSRRRWERVAGAVPSPPGGSALGRAGRDCVHTYSCTATNRPRRPVRRRSRPSRPEEPRRRPLRLSVKGSRHVWQRQARRAWRWGRPTAKIHRQAVSDAATAGTDERRYPGPARLGRTALRVCVKTSWHGCAIRIPVGAGPRACPSR